MQFEVLRVSGESIKRHLHEELRTVCILSTVCHGKQKRFVVLQSKSFICKENINNSLNVCNLQGFVQVTIKRSSVNRFTSSSIPIREISGLNHKILHHTVKYNSLELNVSIIWRNSSVSITIRPLPCNAMVYRSSGQCPSLRCKAIGSSRKFSGQYLETVRTRFVQLAVRPG